MRRGISKVLLPDLVAPPPNTDWWLQWHATFHVRALSWNPGCLRCVAHLQLNCFMFPDIDLQRS